MKLNVHTEIEFNDSSGFAVVRLIKDGKEIRPKELDLPGMAEIDPLWPVSTHKQEATMHWRVATGIDRMVRDVVADAEADAVMLLEIQTDAEIDADAEIADLLAVAEVAALEPTG